MVIDFDVEFCESCEKKFKKECKGNGDLASVNYCDECAKKLKRFFAKSERKEKKDLIKKVDKMIFSPREKHIVNCGIESFFKHE